MNKIELTAEQLSIAEDVIAQRISTPADVTRDIAYDALARGIAIGRAEAQAGDWVPVPPRACIKPTHDAANAFWHYWRINGETHKHGYYESTWGAINAALAHGWEQPEPSAELSDELLNAACMAINWPSNDYNKAVVRKVITAYEAKRGRP